ncbi:septal ring lytic transglycosylase RlpA family protein [Oceanobacter antarcticus]|uniref:Endolytic peptidoglycan transglycosylase RlpA n=1 Tax=Oceanobacter antarcticus TaxID=3133425 RepID=A0ABW8NDC2_9GAMM
MKTGLWLIMALLLSACSSRYQHREDFSPPVPPDLSTLKEPTPTSEALSVMGNGPTYKVLGKRYQVLEQPRTFREAGTASWYGMKFHGHATANGEIYDVYQFTAAHKTLPLPSYVKVTRQDNGKSVVVRVNDRGPFYKDRIIDLSYVAAHKIGLDISGTAPVTIELLKPPLPDKVRWVQVSALSDQPSANKQQQALRDALKPLTWPVEVYQGKLNGKPLHKVRIGPVPEGKPLQDLLARLDKLHINNPVVLGAHQLN